MRERLVEYLACPDCGGELRLACSRRDGWEIREGRLDCQNREHSFPVVRGIPRLISSAVADLSSEVAAGFGWEWNEFSEIRGEYRQQFLDWVKPLEPGDFAGKRVLEGGCGKGRHSALVAQFGAKEVFSLDLGSAVEAAYRNTGHLENVHVIQADLCRPPLKTCADLAFSVGVLHHLPDPAVGFHALVDRLVPGGRIAVWVYGREGNEWIVDWVDPVRTRVTARMPRRVLYELARPIGYLLAATAKGLYKPLADTVPSLHRQLFYRDYLTYIARLPAREIHSIVFDQLVTPVAYYLSRDEVAAWFSEARLGEFAIEQHNGNSWRAQARVLR